MQKKYIGSFISVDTAKAEVNSLIADGHDRADITLLSSPLIADELADATHIPVLPNTGDDNSGLKKIKSLFKKDDDENSDDPYVVYKDDIEQGKIVLSCLMRNKRRFNSQIRSPE